MCVDKVLAAWLLACGTVGYILQSACARTIDGGPGTRGFPGGCKPLKEAITKPGYEVFARGLEASDFQFKEGQQYTVFVPEDGKLVADNSGANGLLGSFAAAGVDPFSVERMRESSLFPLLKDYFPYLVADKALTKRDLQGGVVFETLFNTQTGSSCVPPGSPVDPKIVDNRIYVLRRDGDILLEDASTKTAYSKIVGQDKTCEGSVVYFIETLLTPCCAAPAGEVCLEPGNRAPAPVPDDTALPPEFRDNQINATE